MLIPGEEFVLKKIPLSCLKSRNKKDTLKEVMILRKLKHQHIIRYYHSFVENDALYILMEYADGGDLHTLMRKHRGDKKPIPEKELWRYGYEISLGVEYLHKNNILHRDIKSLNIFLTKDNTVKIGDLGVSKIISGTA